MQAERSGPLWAEFDDRMRTAMKDSASFAVTLSGISGSLGRLDSVQREQVVTPEKGVWVYIATCRFAAAPGPIDVTFVFDDAGRVGSLLVRPTTVPRKEHPSAFLDYHPKAPLRLPFRGEWTVFWGGRTLEQNYHAFTRDQRFALDVVIMREGRTHAGDGRKLTDYYCYGQPVLAPAAGTIVWAQDSLPDQAPGQQDPAHAAGNSVVIDHGNGEYSLFAHLQPGSLRFKPGERVGADAVVGLCGNSGNTTEPHIHFHLQNGPVPFKADGLPLEFVQARRGWTAARAGGDREGPAGAAAALTRRGAIRQANGSAERSAGPFELCQSVGLSRRSNSVSICGRSSVFASARMRGRR